MLEALDGGLVLAYLLFEREPFLFLALLFQAHTLFAQTGHRLNGYIDLVARCVGLVDLFFHTLLHIAEITLVLHTLKRLLGLLSGLWNNAT